MILNLRILTTDSINTMRASGFPLSGPVGRLRLRIAVLISATALLAACQTAPIDDGPIAPSAAQTTSKIADLQTQLGIGYLRQGKLELAWKRLHKALEHDPNYSTANNAMGLIHERLGQPEKAEGFYIQAVTDNPADSAAQNNFGRFLCAQGRYEEGEQRLLRALKNTLYESPHVAYANAGICSKSAGQPERAEAYFRRALEAQPRLAVALVNMSELSFEKQKHLSARAYLQRYLEVGKHTPQSLWLGIRIERELGDRNAVSSYGTLLRAQFPDARETELYLDSLSN